jgi:hypothetical protein
LKFNFPAMVHAKRLAYQNTFLGPNGKPLPFAAEVLADLKRYCGINKGGLVVSPVGRTVDPYATTVLHSATYTYALHNS